MSRDCIELCQHKSLLLYETQSTPINCVRVSRLIFPFQVWWVARLVARCSVLCGHWSHSCHWLLHCVPTVRPVQTHWAGPPGVSVCPLPQTPHRRTPSLALCLHSFKPCWCGLAWDYTGHTTQTLHMEERRVCQCGMIIAASHSLWWQHQPGDTLLTPHSSPCHITCSVHLLQTCQSCRDIHTNSHRQTVFESSH